MNDKIYAMKAKRTGSACNGRFKAPDIQDATRQANEYLATLGENWNVTITELKNQASAMKQWNERNN